MPQLLTGFYLDTTFCTQILFGYCILSKQLGTLSLSKMKFKMLKSPTIFKFKVERSGSKGVKMTYLGWQNHKNIFNSQVVYNEESNNYTNNMGCHNMDPNNIDNTEIINFCYACIYLPALL